MTSLVMLVRRVISNNQMRCNLNSSAVIWDLSSSVRDRMRKYFALILSITLISCGPGAGDFSDSLGAGYNFHYTNSTGQFITSSEGVVVDTVILDFVYDKKFVAAVSLESRDYSCKYSLPDGRQVSGLQMAFVDNLIFTVIDKKSNKISRMSGLSEMVSHLKKNGFTKKIEFDLSEKEYRLSQMPLLSINLDECSLISRKND